MAAIIFVLFFIISSFITAESEEIPGKRSKRNIIVNKIEINDQFHRYAIYFSIIIFCPQEHAKSIKSHWKFGEIIIADLITALTLKLDRQMVRNVIHIFMGHFHRELH